MLELHKIKLYLRETMNALKPYKSYDTFAASILYFLFHSILILHAWLSSSLRAWLI